MGWAKSAGTGRRTTIHYQLSAPGAALREQPPAEPGDGGMKPRAPDPGEVQERLRRNRRALPVYDVATGEDLETPVNLDNTLLQAMFPDLRIALGQVPPPPLRATPEQLEAYWQSVLEDLARD